MHGHKAIMSGFLSNYETNGVMNIDSEYDNQTIDETTVELFLQFIYTGTFEIPPTLLSRYCPSTFQQSYITPGSF